MSTEKCVKILEIVNIQDVKNMLTLIAVFFLYCSKLKADWNFLTFYNLLTLFISIKKIKIKHILKKNYISICQKYLLVLVPIRFHLYLYVTYYILILILLFIEQ